jgi:hypothetical protein
LNRLKAHVVDFYEEVLPPGEFETKVERVDELVEKYKGRIWEMFARKYPAEIIAKHKGAWDAGREAAIQGDVIYQRQGPAEFAGEEEVAPFKPMARAAGPTQKILPPAAAAAAVVPAPVPAPAPVAAAAAAAVVPPPAPAPAAAAAPRAPVVPGIPVAGIPPLKKTLGPEGKRIAFRLVVATDATGARIFNMYNDATNEFVGVTTYKADGTPGVPPRFVPGFKF